LKVVPGVTTRTRSWAISGKPIEKAIRITVVAKLRRSEKIFMSSPVLGKHFESVVGLSAEAGHSPNSEEVLPVSQNHYHP
jgi:hypothetical protein